jgi:hypothetical protein
VSGEAVAEPAAPSAGPSPIACPRCGAAVGADQAWCLECGLAARTRLARTPNWRAPLVAAGVIGLAAIVALVVAFLVLTGDNTPLPVTATTPATTPAAVPPATTTPAVPAVTTPASTTPTTPATTTPPPTTTTVPPATTPTTTPTTPATTTAPTGAD